MFFSSETKCLPARYKLNPQVGWDGTTGKYCLAKTQAQSVVCPLAFFLLAESIQEKPSIYGNRLLVVFATIGTAMNAGDCPRYKAPRKRNRLDKTCP